MSSAGGKGLLRRKTDYVQCLKLIIVCSTYTTAVENATQVLESASRM